MNESLKKAYDDLNNAFTMLSIDEKRQEIVNKLEEIISILNALKQNNTNFENLSKQYQNEDEFLCYLNSIVYNLDNHLGNLFEN